MKEQKKDRFWEIDTLRGIAIIMMIIYHVIFDLNWFYVYPINLRALPLLVFLYPIGTMFLFLVGVSLTLSFSHAQKTLTGYELPLKILLRGIKVFLFGMILTVVTWFYLRQGYIIFGVLHCIGVSIILAYPLLRYRLSNLILGWILIIIGLFIYGYPVGVPWLLWLGLVPYGFYTIDYFPLLPWFGVVLLGVFVGNTVYKEGKRQFFIRDLSQNKGIQTLSVLGRHSLLIYLVHQPVLIGLILLFTR
ncbi:MAG: heparan-alpha-glucosaminide N-acetyltransferase [Methanobacteriota archaeon]